MGLLISRLEALIMSVIAGDIGRLILLVLNISLGLEEEGIQGSDNLYVECFCKITVWAQAAFEQIFFHIVLLGNLDDFFIEFVNERPKGFIFSLQDGSMGLL